jgi:hypothetical protein
LLIKHDRGRIRIKMLGSAAGCSISSQNISSLFENLVSISSPLFSSVMDQEDVWGGAAGYMGMKARHFIFKKNSFNELKIFNLKSHINFPQIAKLVDQYSEQASTEGSRHGIFSGLCFQFRQSQVLFLFCQAVLWTRIFFPETP